MAQVTLTINGRSYSIGCEDGQEQQVEALGQDLDRRARALAEATGAVAEGLILVLTSLTLSDELADARRSRDKAQETLNALSDEAESMVAEKIAAAEADAEAAISDVREEAEATIAAVRDEAETSIAELQAELDALRGQSQQQVMDARARADRQIAEAQAEAARSGEGHKQEFERLEAEGLALKAQLGEAKQALEAARSHLELRRNEHQALRQAEDDIASALERMAARIETVARSLSAS